MSCKRAGQRKNLTTARRIRVAPEHPLAGKTGLVSEARAVLYEKVGPSPQACHWCGRSITWAVGKRGNSRQHVIADHLDSDEFNDAPENLVPSCGPCNGTREVKVSDDEPYRVRANGSRLRGTPRICEACESDFVAWDTTRGRGRFCSRTCARKAPRKAQLGSVTDSS